MNQIWHANTTMPFTSIPRYIDVYTHPPCLLDSHNAERTYETKEKEERHCMHVKQLAPVTLLIDRIETSWQHWPFGILARSSLLDAWAHEWYAWYLRVSSPSLFTQRIDNSTRDRWEIPSSQLPPVPRRPLSVAYCALLSWRIRISPFPCGHSRSSPASGTHNRHLCNSPLLSVSFPWTRIKSITSGGSRILRWGGAATIFSMKHKHYRIAQCKIQMHSSVLQKKNQKEVSDPWHLYQNDAYCIHRFSSYFE
jgi:hypothetical protein